MCIIIDKTHQTITVEPAAALQEIYNAYMERIDDFDMMDCKPALEVRGVGANSHLATINGWTFLRNGCPLTELTEQMQNA